jgi:uncharacterized SAM-binding protein YcdF (DUF218 family)
MEDTPGGNAALSEGRRRIARLAWGLALGALAGEFVRELDLATLVSFNGDRQYVILGAAILGGALALTPLRSLAAVAAAGLGALWLAVCFTPVSAWLAHGLVRRDPLAPADAVYVLASNIQKDDDPSASAASRLWRALELVAEGETERLVLCEMPPPAGRYEPIARAWMSAFHLGRELVVLKETSNTREEAVEVARLCRERGFTRLLVVTSPTHTRRACAAFEREGLGVVCVPAIETQFDVETLEKPGDRVKAFGPIVHERLGLFVYRRRDWIR